MEAINSVDGNAIQFVNTLFKGICVRANRLKAKLIIILTISLITSILWSLVMIKNDHSAAIAGLSFAIIPFVHLAIVLLILRSIPTLSKLKFRDNGSLEDVNRIKDRFLMVFDPSGKSLGFNVTRIFVFLGGVGDVTRSIYNSVLNWKDVVPAIRNIFIIYNPVHLLFIFLSFATLTLIIGFEIWSLWYMFG